MMRTLREPYIELMFGKRAKTGRRGETRDTLRLLACLITVRMTTEYAPPYSPTHGPPGRDETRRPHETTNETEGGRHRPRPACLLAYTTTWMMTSRHIAMPATARHARHEMRTRTTWTTWTTSPRCLLACHTAPIDDAPPYRNARHEMRTRTMRMTWTTPPPPRPPACLPTTSGRHDTDDFAPPHSAPRARRQAGRREAMMTWNENE